MFVQDGHHVGIDIAPTVDKFVGTPPVARMHKAAEHRAVPPECESLSASPHHAGDCENALGLQDVHIKNGTSPMGSGVSGTTSGIEREDSLMQDVRQRMVKLDCLRPGNAVSHVPSVPSVHASPSGGCIRAQTPASSWITPRSWVCGAKSPAVHFVNTHSTPYKTPLRRMCKGVRHLCDGFHFRTAVMSGVTLAVLLACVGMCVPLEVFMRHVRSKTIETYAESTQKQGDMIEDLTLTSGNWAHTSTLKETGMLVHTTVLDPAVRAVETLWGTMRTFKSHNSTWPLRDETFRSALARRAVIELTDQFAFDGPDSKRGGVTSRAEYLYVGYPTDEFTGASVQCLADCSKLDVRLYDAAANITRGDVFLKTWQADGATFNRGQLLSDVLFNASQRPWYTLQKQLAGESADMEFATKPRRAWSKVYPFVDGNIGLTLTSPVTYCGNYSCFDGVVAADITLQAIVDGCAAAWEVFRKILADRNFDFPVGASNSSIFIVNHVSRHRDQEGYLLGASHWNGGLGGQLRRAEESEHPMVRVTANALLWRFGNWRSANLTEKVQFFSFKGSAAEQDEPLLCDVTDAHLEDDEDCLQVGTLSVRLDSETRWLVVIVSPAQAFTKRAFATTQEVDRQFEQLQANINEMINKVRLAGLIIFGVMTLLSLVLGVGLSALVSDPLRRLAKLMRKLGELDFAHGSPEARELQDGKRARISDVCELQDAFQRLSRGLETFARFVPETVVRNIVRGDERATRLHVSRRVVTIMFSDIRDFTTISEKLRPRDLLLLLTRYLGEMTKVVQEHEGVVAEILGDGLLVFWNTPDDVENHASKACAAALVMQKKLVDINAELTHLKMPPLAIRIGLHTGEVLSGNIGSDNKMKFGCIGDPVNLASRLEGLCKNYGVGIICSGATHSHLRLEDGFVCRKLDLVQVKGKGEPTEVYELMEKEPAACGEQDTDVEAGYDSMCQIDSSLSYDIVIHEASPLAAASAEIMQASDDASTRPEARRSMRLHARCYEEALEAYQARRFAVARSALEALLKEFPDDAAAQRLLQRVEQQIQPLDRGSSDRETTGTISATWTVATVMTDK